MKETTRKEIREGVEKAVKIQSAIVLEGLRLKKELIESVIDKFSDVDVEEKSTVKS